MRVTLLGTGDTTGTPTPGCDCDTCERARAEGVERTRFSVLVENERTGERLLVDVSPDFRRQFLRADRALPDAAVITHAHFDHLGGLGNAYRVFDDLPVYAAAGPDPDVGDRVAATVRDQFDYLDPVTVHAQAPLSPVEVCGFEVTFVPVVHPPLPGYGLVVEGEGATLALTGDTAYGVPPESRDALRGADLLLADAIAPASVTTRREGLGSDHHDGVAYTFAGKHMTREGALALAADLDVARTRLVHVAHFYPADEAFADPLAVDGETHTL